MAIDLFKRKIKDKQFSVEVKVNGKRAGEAIFFEQGDEPGVFGARVDINGKFRGKGLATEALKAGDKIVREEFPGAHRRFVDVNGLTYRRYTDSIGDDQIIDIDDKGILFRP